MKLKNQHQQAIYYLSNWQKFSLKDVINDSMFFKFQTRLSEIEAEHGQIAIREQVKFTSKFGRKSKYYVYSACVNKVKLKEIFESYD